MPFFGASCNWGKFLRSNFLQTSLMQRTLNRGTFLIFIAAMLWATDAPFRVALLAQVSSVFLVFGEHAVDTLFVLPFIIACRRELWKFSAREWIALLCIGVGGSAIASLLFTSAFAYTNPSVALVLQKIQPFLVIILSCTFLSEKLSRRFWLWAGCAIAGAYLLTFPHLMPRVYEGEVFNPNIIGVSLALSAAGLWAVSTVLGKYALRRIDPMLVTSMRFFIAFVFLLLLNVARGTIVQAADLSLRGWGYLVMIACVSGVLSLWLYYRGLKTTLASVATLVELGYPLAAVIVNYFTISAPLLWQQVLGMVFLLVAVLRLASMRERASNAQH